MGYVLDRRLGIGKLLGVCLWVCSDACVAAQIDLTRELIQVTAGNAQPAGRSFFAVPGKGRVLVSGAGQLSALSLELNGRPLEGLPLQLRVQPVELPVTLIEQNRLTLSAAASLPTRLEVRVKQRSEVTLHVESRVHFNANVSDFAAARAFYGQLGFKTLTGFPDTNTQAMARAIGIQTPTVYDGSQGEEAGGYLLHGELIGVGGFSGGLIDLIEFTIPKNEAPPYAKLNHLGMAYAAMLTSDIDSDYQTLQDRGVEFLSAPVTRADGTRFAMFKDPDGTFYELREAAGDEGDDTHIFGLDHVNVNASDFERSSAWYQMFGYQPVAELASTESGAVAKAMGLAAHFEIKGARFEHPEDGSALQIVQWLQPYDPERAYPLPVNHLGLHRMAYATSDIEADVATLKAQGVEFVSPITPCCSGPDSPGSIVAFYDPDGTIVELVEQPFMTELMSVLGWFKSLFD